MRVSLSELWEDRRCADARSREAQRRLCTLVAVDSNESLARLRNQRKKVLRRRGVHTYSCSQDVQRTPPGYH